MFLVVSLDIHLVVNSLLVLEDVRLVQLHLVVKYAVLDALVCQFEELLLYSISEQKILLVALAWETSRSLVVWIGLDIRLKLL